MKFLIAFIFIIVTGCNNMKITHNPSNHTATSGTLGSANFTNKLPEVTDTIRRMDTLKIIRDTLR